MSEDEKINKPRRPGERLKSDEAKIEIIEYILSRNNAITGPDIRNHLREKFRMKDRKNIEDHLKELQKKRCIEKFERNGFENRWDITKIKTLKSIKDNHSDMQLNKYEKSKMIILYESGYDIRTPEGLKIYIQLLLSKSFFDECINTGIETLCDIAWEFYLCDKGFHIDQDVKQNLNECYTTLRKRDPNFKMSEEEFKKTIEEIFFKVCEEMFPGLSIGKPNKKTLEMKKLLKMIPEREKILESVLNACKERFSAWPKEASTETYIKGAEIIQHLETTDINEN